MKGVPFEEGIRKVSVSCQKLYLKGEREGAFPYETLSWPLPNGDLNSVINEALLESWERGMGMFTLSQNFKTRRFAY